MALRLSTGLRTFLMRAGSFKNAFENGVLKIYTGSQPSTADTAVSGTLLNTISLASGAVTSEVLATGTVTLTGGNSGTISSLTVNSVQLLAAAVSYDTDLSTTATALATAINDNITVPKYTASASGAVVTISAMPMTGTTPNGYVVASSVTGTLTKSDVNMAGGVAAVNGLTFGNTASGVISKTGTWSGVAVATGTAGWFRLQGSATDAGSTSTTLLRLDGNISTSGANLNMSSTSITSGATSTIDQFDITMPAS